MPSAARRRRELAERHSERRRATGRARQVRRHLEAPYTVGPEHRARVPARLRALVEQREALAALERYLAAGAAGELPGLAGAVDAATGRGRGWRADGVATRRRVLAAMIHRAEWDTGEITVTREVLTAAARVGLDRVREVIGEALAAELLVELRGPLSPGWLGAEHGAAPVYAVVVPRVPGADQLQDRAGAAQRDADGRDGPPRPDGPASGADRAGGGAYACGDVASGERSTRSSVPASSGVSSQVNRLDPNPPTGSVGRERSLERRDRTSERTPRRWPRWRVPTTPSERAAAAAVVLTDVGLEAREVPRQALYGLLRRWWDAGWCPAGLVHALGYRPGQPDRDGDRGDLRRGTDPGDRAAVVRIMGHRLQAWVGRRDELPAGLRGLQGDYLAEQAARLAHDVAAGETRRTERERTGHVPTAAAAVRAAAAADIRRTLVTTRAARPRRTSDGTVTAR